MKGGWVYIMSNAPFGTLYVGVTSDLARRVWQHRNGEGSAFCRRYGLTRLVYCEHYERIEDAIAREKAMKAWKRQWKTRRIEEANPAWDDLFDHALGAWAGLDPSFRWGDVGASSPPLPPLPPGLIFRA